ncbi:hypothetical protein [Bradyrhizobium sp. ORS 86]|uniref:hypothetical protein n=1 Tax=Bradyrhizobium sp. ORS 86 TaxID=1685970 RepID=UPI00389038CF
MSGMTVRTHVHSVIWIDHFIAKIFSVGMTGASATAVRARLPSQQLHHKANTTGPGCIHEDPTFFIRVGEAVGGCTDLLIIGPGAEKTDLMHFLIRARPDLTVHVEPCDRPSDREIVALGRKRFHLD